MVHYVPKDYDEANHISCPLQISLTVEDCCGQNLTLREYVQRSLCYAETLGGAIHLLHEKEEPSGAGGGGCYVFEYLHDVAFYPQGKTRTLQIRNYVRAREGIYYTLQLLSRADMFGYHTSSFEELMASMRFLPSHLPPKRQRFYRIFDPMSGYLFDAPFLPFEEVEKGLAKHDEDGGAVVVFQAGWLTVRAVPEEGLPSLPMGNSDTVHVVKPHFGSDTGLVFEARRNGLAAEVAATARPCSKAKLGPDRVPSTKRAVFL